MEQRKHEMGLLDLMNRPAFCVAEGKITQVNAAAAAFGLAPQMELAPLLANGSEEYDAFEDGCLYLSLALDGARMGASVRRMEDFDVFCLEETEDSRELRAMALAAMELRAPLSAVMVTAQRLFPVSGLEDAPAIREQVAQINRGLYQMLRALDNMSDAGHYTATARMETQNLTVMLAEIFEKDAALLEQGQHQLVYEGPEQAIYGLADREKLERAMHNIVSNAAKFSPPGSTIRAKLTQHGQKLRLSVEDSGSGIPAGILGNVYTRYQRQCGVEDTRFGIGLGMVLIRAAADVHGGAVLIDQPHETGTRVTLTLAIRQGQGEVHSGLLYPDYSGEMDHALIELSDCLPASLYEKEI